MSLLNFIGLVTGCAALLGSAILVCHLNERQVGIPLGVASAVIIGFNLGIWLV